MADDEDITLDETVDELTQREMEQNHDLMDALDEVIQNGD